MAEEKHSAAEKAIACRARQLFVETQQLLDRMTRRLEELKSLRDSLVLLESEAGKKIAGEKEILV